MAESDASMSESAGAESAAAESGMAATAIAAAAAAGLPSSTAGDSRALALLAAEACDDRKAVDIRLIRVDEISSLADWFVICSGLTDVQVRAIARSVEDSLELEAGRLPLRREGQREGRWVLLDFGDVVVHVFYHESRSFYDLEGLWHDAPRIDPEELAAAASNP